MRGMSRGQLPPMVIEGTGRPHSDVRRRGQAKGSPSEAQHGWEGAALGSRAADLRVDHPRRRTRPSNAEWRLAGAIDA